MLEQVEKNPDGGHPILRGMSAEGAVNVLKRQLNAFWKGEYPFEVNDEHDKMTNPPEWWRPLENHKYGQLLAVCLFIE